MCVITFPLIHTFEWGMILCLSVLVPMFIRKLDYCAPGHIQDWRFLQCSSELLCPGSLWCAEDLVESTSIPLNHPVQWKLSLMDVFFSEFFFFFWLSCKLLVDSNLPPENSLLKAHFLSSTRTLSVSAAPQRSSNSASSCRWFQVVHTEGAKPTSLLVRVMGGFLDHVGANSAVVHGLTHFCQGCKGCKSQGCPAS